MFCFGGTETSSSVLARRRHPGGPINYTIRSRSTNCGFPGTLIYDHDHKAMADRTPVTAMPIKLAIPSRFTTNSWLRLGM
jgi:hypothetical protein